MGTFRERILGSLETQSAAGCWRAMRFARSSTRIRATRRIAELGDPDDHLTELLRSPLPGVRRGAARARDLPALWSALERERVASVAVALAAGCVRMGRSRREVQALLERRVLVSMHTQGGPRTPESSLGLGIGEPMQDLELALANRERTLASLREASSGPARWEAMERVGGLGDPRDQPLLLQYARSAGKRGQNHLLLALGRNGDPRSLPRLKEQLSGIGVDPGRGFAWRRLSALAMGRIGDPAVGPQLLRALVVEAREHEGSPGAGLGIQFPVRSVLLWALGELQHRPAVPALLAHLDLSAGSALGGFHLPAMGALYKIGAVIRPELERLAKTGGEAGEHAQGVLQAWQDQ